MIVIWLLYDFIWLLYDFIWLYMIVLQGVHFELSSFWIVLILNCPGQFAPGQFARTIRQPTCMECWGDQNSCLMSVLITTVTQIMMHLRPLAVASAIVKNPDLIKGILAFVAYASTPATIEHIDFIKDCDILHKWLPTQDNSATQDNSLPRVYRGIAEAYRGSGFPLHDFLPDCYDFCCRVHLGPSLEYAMT